MRFAHETLGQRVVFATGDVVGACSAEVARLGGSRIMVIATDRDAERVDRLADALPVALRHQEVVMHVPRAVADRAREAAAAAEVDLVLSVGGGSATGLAKAVALTSGVPIVAVPTTYAGSEATNVWGLTEDGIKQTGVDARVLPASVVYDATLLATLPADLAVASGLNALAHCVDSMWAPRTDPLDQALAQEGVRALSAGLPVVAADPADLAGIEQTLYGAYLAAVAFASAGSGMHHKICHVLGGMFDLPHAQTHAVVLPYVLAFNVGHAPGAGERLAAAFGAASATSGLRELRRTLAGSTDLPVALRDYGMPEAGVSRAVQPVLDAVPADNPAPANPQNIRALLQAAWEGSDPS